MPGLASACTPKFQARLGSIKPSLISTEKLRCRAVTLVITLHTACLLPHYWLFSVFFSFLSCQILAAMASTPLDSLRITFAMAPKGDKLSWTMDHDIRLVRVLMNERVAGHQAENGWKGVAWAAAEKEFGEDPPPKRTAMKCSDHWTHVCQFLFITSRAHSCVS
jgi:hypothetical protein